MATVALICLSEGSAGCSASQATVAPLSLEVGRKRRVLVAVWRFSSVPDSGLAGETVGVAMERRREREIKHVKSHIFFFKMQYR